MEELHIKKSHNKSLLLYHIVCPAKYSRKVFSEEVEKTLKETCEGISQRYEISITAIQIFKKHPEVKKKLWGGKFWTSGYYVNTVGQYGNASMIKKYVQNQGLDYKTILQNEQLSLF